MRDEATPLVSVIIPTYNHGRYLGRALQSVLDQTYTNWEAIVIDNHSTDNTDEVMASFASPHITYLKINNNGVIAVSRNSGIRAAKGDWIAFLDSDDWWTSDKLTTCINCKDGNHDLIYHDLKIVSEKPSLFGNNKIRSWQVKSPVLTDLLVRGNAIATSSVVVRAQLLKSVGGMSERSELIAAEDYNAWLRIAKISNGFKYLPKELGFYQLSPQSVSAQKDMSIPTNYAAVDFLDFVNLSQRNAFKGYLSYTRGRYNYLIGEHGKAEKDFNLVIKQGSKRLAIKAFLMIVLLKLFKICLFLFKK
jgi:glycosyltransferase involved in cell wall biosynthesis